MNKKEFEFILQEGEGQFIEFKEHFDSSFAKEIVAFANASGGRIFLGVSDNKNIKGIKITNRLKSQIQDAARNCDPSINIKFEEFNKNILIINIKEGQDKPYKCSSGFYLRQGSNSQKMKRDEILDFSISENKIKFDTQINEKFIFKKDFDKEKLEEFLQKAKITKLLPYKKMFQELNITKDSKFTNAGVLFFAKNPQKFISHSVFTCALFKNNEGTDIIDRKEIKGSIIEIVEEVMKFVEKDTKVAYKFTGKPERENIYEYPLEAIREAVINSVMHRDYFEEGHNNILNIYPDHIKITNAWLKPSWFQIGKDTFRRNKLIADLFLRIRFIEKLGTGFERMKIYCKKVNAPQFKFDINEKFFRVIFYQSNDYLKLVDKKAVCKRTCH